MITIINKGRSISKKNKNETEEKKKKKDGNYIQTRYIRYTKKKS